MGKSKFILVGIMGMLIGILLSGQVYGGAWTMGKGHMYNKLAFNYFKSTNFYDQDGDRHGLPYSGEFRDLNLNWYQEIGLTDRITFLSSFYYKWLRDDNHYVYTRSNGMTDFDLGLKVNLFKEPVVLSLQGLFKVKGPYDSHETPGLGNDQNDFELRLLLGKSLYPLPMYLGLEAGYRWRFEDPSDDWRYLVEIGGDFTSWMYGRVKLDGLVSANNADKEETAYTNATGANITLTPEFDLIKLETTLGFHFTRKWGLEFSYTPTIYGENTAAGYTLTSAIIFTF